MTKERAEFFKDAAETAGLEVEIRSDYGGRGMKIDGKTLNIFKPEEVIPLIRCKKRNKIGGNTRTTFNDKHGNEYLVNLRKNKFLCLRKNPRCVCCGTELSFFIMRKTRDNQAMMESCGVSDNGDIVLMTMDHIIPVSVSKKNRRSGGVSQTQTMCETCNNLKSNHDVSMKNLLIVKKIYDKNKDKFKLGFFRNLLRLVDHN